LELVPYGILAALTVAIGLVGPLVTDFLQETFRKYYTESLSPHLVVTTSAASGLNAFMPLSILVSIISVFIIAVAAIPAYRLYISHKVQPEQIISGHTGLRRIYGFLWNRWYIDAFYNKVFANGTLAVREPLMRFIERPLDYALNNGIPRFFATVNRGFRKLQTGVLSVNILYMLVFLGLAVLILLLLGVI
jgi:NADH-quinone oxidoreductase subunit L